MRGPVLILGGARSGKSDLAQRLAESCAPDGTGRLVYVATAQTLDQEMAERVARHQAVRGPAWSTVEEPLELEQALAGAAGPGAVLLVDCLTLWLSNLLTRAEMEPAQAWGRCQALIDLAPTLEARLILVANEVGLGIVPDNALARTFRDLAGQLNRGLAQVCPHVFLVAAGLPLTLKGDPGLLSPA